MTEDSPQLGALVPGWTPPPFAGAETMAGRFACLNPLRATSHAMPLFDAFKGYDKLWAYLPYGPFAVAADYAEWVETAGQSTDPLFFAVCDVQTGVALGVASYLRIKPDAGSIEVGHICFSPLLQKSLVATDAMMLMMARAFELGYRRYEWKCDALNLPSRRAAQRLGFSYEGVFRQAAVVKGRNRDTAWFSVLDSEWPRLRAVFETWRAPENFDMSGRQRSRLSALTRPIVTKPDPLL
ncbi:MAG: GNAT family protein [Pseudomonadota bacterium]